MSVEETARLRAQLHPAMRKIGLVRFQCVSQFRCSGEKTQITDGKASSSSSTLGGDTHLFSVDLLRLCSFSYAVYTLLIVQRWFFCSKGGSGACGHA